MSADQSTERHPFTSMLLLLLFILGGCILFTCLAIVIALLVYGKNSFAELRETGITLNTIGFLKIVQIGYSIGAFIISAVLFARSESNSILSYLNLNKRTPLVLILTSIAVMFSVVYLSEWTAELNKQMHFPQFLKGVETWMREKEDQAALETREFLSMTSLTGLLINLFIVAVLPGIGEELTFRGCFQKIFTKWTGSYHWGIWIAAIIFSIVHFEFYGFLPRMLLGALFGYLYVWGRSLWLPIIAHFVNNATIVILAYQYQLSGKSLDKLDDNGAGSWQQYLFSALITTILLFVFYRYYNKPSADLLEQEI